MSLAVQWSTLAARQGLRAGPAAGRRRRHAAALARHEGVRDEQVRPEETPARSDRAAAEAQFRAAKEQTLSLYSARSLRDSLIDLQGKKEGFD